jgi:hypothetical protein
LVDADHEGLGARCTLAKEGKGYLASFSWPYVLVDVTKPTHAQVVVVGRCNSKRFETNVE